jgi:hypothetical protein
MYPGLIASSPKTMADFSGSLFFLLKEFKRPDIPIGLIDALGSIMQKFDLAAFNENQELLNLYTTKPNQWPYERFTLYNAKIAP